MESHLEGGGGVDQKLGRHIVPCWPAESRPRFFAMAERHRCQARTATGFFPFGFRPLKRGPEPWPKPFQTAAKPPGKRRQTAGPTGRKARPGQLAGPRRADRSRRRGAGAVARGRSGHGLGAVPGRFRARLARACGRFRGSVTRRASLGARAAGEARETAGLPTTGYAVHQSAALSLARLACSTVTCRDCDSIVTEPPDSNRRGRLRRPYRGELGQPTL